MENKALPLKNRTLFLLSIIFLAIIMLTYWCRKPCPYVCPGYEEKTVRYLVNKDTQEQEADTVTSTIQVSYVCNEIILDLKGTSPGRADSLRDYLESRDFKKVDSCACMDKLELWRYDDEGDVNVIGVIQNPIGDVGSVGGFALNYNTFQSPLQYNADSIPGYLSNANPDIDSPIVKIAIVDTGVDISPPALSPSPDPQAYLHPFLWEKTTQPCNKIPAKPFGLNVLNLDVPSDLNGHGTHVNGIIAGYPLQAISNEVVIDPPNYKKRIRLELLNVRYTRGDTGSGSLFKAVCAMYYALGQGAEVVNISWGFLNTETPKILEDVIKQDTNVIFVAGMGNDSIGFLSVDDLRFWPAGFSASHNNVISVGASNVSENALAIFSNWGDIDIMNVVATGQNIVSTFPKYLQWPQTGIAKNSGTSMAAPFVTRAVAIMIGKKKAMGQTPTAMTIKIALKAEANPNRVNGTSPRYLYVPGDAVAVPF